MFHVLDVQECRLSTDSEIPSSWKGGGLDCGLQMQKNQD